MCSDENALSENSLEEVSKVAISTYMNIMQQWDVSDEDQLSLLGLNAVANVEKLKEELVSSMTSEMLDRISFVLKIYKYLQVLFPEREQSNSWINKGNDAFDGKTALMVILSDNENGLLTVAKYLYSQFQMPNVPLDKQAQKEYILFLILEWVDSTEDALSWYENEVLPALGMTAQQAVEYGEYHLVLKYIKLVDLGGYA
ncbi:antitoxin Xre/MbcA/ParS toxin-binding domain-containing protein [Thalassotalea sp. Y01]|uniref:antitoxin Xre/MbcA/ParS toxin-binding domain-containing protein n=1 Tax=Thalassotalea sp. Y01 TaxID=2729613 RepID=UPI00145F64E3|nr:antitoxin Xre/MbcA/ParS toxin-binding domain-containing protein [Thalassotalea sp. Y01]NMP16235.1 DUF2384 domain-containing protein [Thalassotalea sp. Y01]